MLTLQWRTKFGVVPLLAPHAKNRKQCHVLHERRAIKREIDRNLVTKLGSRYIMTSVVLESRLVQGDFVMAPT